MKLMKRKLLSLLLAMAMVLTLAPTALAEGENEGSEETPPPPATYSSSIAADPAEISAGGQTTITLTTNIPDSAWYGADWICNPSDGVTLTPASNGKSATLKVSSTFTGTSVKVECDPQFTNDAGVNTENWVSTTVKVIPVEEDPVATKIAFSGNSATLDAGNSMVVTATPQDANSQAVSGATVSWSNSSLPTGITVTPNGNKVTIEATSALTEETKVTVTATLTSNRDVYDSFEVTVKPAAATATGSITTDASRFQVGGTITLLLNVTTGSADVSSVKWSSDSANYVTINTITGTLTNGSTTTAVRLDKAGKVTITAEMFDSSGKVIGTAKYTLTISSPLVIEPDQKTLTYYGESVTLTAYYGNEIATDVIWSIEDTSASNRYNNGYVTLSPIATSGKATVTAVATTSRTTPTYIRATYVVGSETFIDRCAVYTNYSGAAFATATVYDSSSGYALGDVDDAGKSSIVSQLDNYFYSTTNGRYGVAYVRFGSNTSGNYGSLNASTNYEYYADRYAASNSSRYLSDVLFYPGSTKGTASFPITVYYYTSSNYQTSNNISSVSGTITFNVTEGTSTGDIVYSASIGDDVTFALKDFEDFYYTKTRGTLNYVSFTLPSGGSLYADGGRLGSSNACYVSPTRTQTDLAGVYFSPTGTTATRASTVRISFTAYGNRTTASGTVAITYLAGSAKDITYTASTTATLKASDFTAAYKEVVGSTAPTGLTIQFQTVPTYGTLSYKDSSRSTSSTVTLRSSNIKSYNFTTRTSGSNQLGDVTYTASGTHSDTIEYIAYVNNTPQFTGKVVFNASNTSATNMQVTFTSTNGQAVAFSYAEFSKANATVLAGTSYIRFVTMPTGGTLTYNGAAMTLSSTNVLPALLGSVVYRPSTGFNNSTDRISFLCYDANGNSVGGGQVSIVVTGNISNGASNISQFKDVSATAWYASDLSTLVNAGIIQGRGDGKFDPTAELTYGEALKIFMLASGYPAQQEVSGKDWAINYKNLAVSNGWLSSSVDLSTKISRNAMAELAAKSLGVSPSSTVPPTWKDGTSNSYANALYYTNPQILIGNADGTFMGNNTLKRQEICAIAARVLTYRSTQQSLDKPSWIG